MERRHTVFATKEEAEAERDQILGIYQDILKNYLAIYAVAGYKSQKEKFAGAEYTCSLESFLESGKAIQGPDFHHDGQNFAKAFDITFIDKEGKKQYAWQNTFAITTRMIGVMIIVHGDDKGLILPPAIAPTQIVIIPILREDSKEKVLAECNKIANQLKSYRVNIDKREEYSPGWKFNEYELKGIPMRIEIGPRDLENGNAILARRDTGEKKTIKLTEIKTEVTKTLKAIQKNLYERSKASFVNNTIKTNDYTELQKAVDNKKIVLAPFCNNPECEDWIKTESPATTTRNSPIGMKVPKGAKCVRCGKEAKGMFYFAKTY
jgi:prolyl-tRNA synthetase